MCTICGRSCQSKCVKHKQAFVLRETDYMVKMTLSVWHTRTFSGDVTDEVPAFNEVWLLALKFDHTLIRSLLELLVLIEPFLGLLM